MDLDEVLALLRRQCDRAGSQVAWARRHNISATYLSDVLQRRRDPGDSILVALHVEKIVTYRRIKSREGE